MVGLKILCTFSFSLFLIISVTPPTTATTDTILTNQTLRYDQTIVSSSGNFEFGFFNEKYLGIWYNFSKETVVWVANRQEPLNDTSCVLHVTSQGVLVIRDSKNQNVWSNNASSSQVKNPVARILDTGNLVVQEADATSGDDHIWQSFDYLCDTLLPGAKLGRNLITGRDNYLVSWKNKSDPSPGKTINMLDINGYPQIFMSVEDTIVLRSGPWNGFSFVGITNLRPNAIFSYQLIYNDEGIYYVDNLVDKTVLSRLVVSDHDFVQRFNWNSSANAWSLYSQQIKDKCDVFGTCGAFGACNISNNPICGCLEGFVPRHSKEWGAGNWSGGCTRRNELSCDSSGQTFERIDGVKLPDTRTSWFNRTMDLMACQRQCLDDCSCTAYAALDISYGTGCLIWFDELLDVREYSGSEQSFYLRSSPFAALGQTDAGRNLGNKNRIGAIVLPVLAAGIILLVILLFLHYRKRSSRATSMDVAYTARDDLELPLFDLVTIDRATEGFSSRNKLGEGGFGPVHKGVLNDGREIAVKRLSKSSGQGMSEFKNEVILIAKLQHRNLVRLLGCCIQGEERMLVYEFMPNKSLDNFIFDQKMKHLLSWEKRVKIVGGIARGLLYLHQDSRLRIIHRDLKASNVLLDANMNPKISDFGMARIFGPDQHMANTRNVVGTYGYMSPEYAVDGVFSTKSDVFSFGVLVLEIITGKRNRSFSHAEHNHNLLGHAWKCWMENKPLVLIDDNLDEALLELDVLRCVHVGLLCVQQRPDDRPNMSSVVLMLGSDSTLPQPTKPGFFTERSMPDSDCSSNNVDSASMNQMSITLLDAR